MSDPVGFLLQKLGPGFDYSSIDRIANSPAFAKLPANMQETIRKLQTLRSEASTPMAPADQISRGAFANPTRSEPMGSLATPAMADQGWALLGNVPILGWLANYDHAMEIHQTTGKPFGQAFDEVVGRSQEAAAEWGHQMTMGLIPSPKVAPDQQEAFNALTKPVMATVAMGMQGHFVYKALGGISMLPKAAALLEQLPQRLVDVGIGATTFGTVDALRADGLPQDPAKIDLSGQIARYLANRGVPDRAALFLGGSTIGGVTGGLILGAARGLAISRDLNLAKIATPEDLAVMRDMLAREGIIVDANQGAYRTAAAYTKMLRKVVNKQGVSGLLGDVQARENWVAQQLFGSATVAPESEEARYLVALMRGQPGSVSVARDVLQAPGEASKVGRAASTLGLRVEVHQIPTGTEDVVAFRGEKPGGGGNVGLGTEGKGIYVTRYPLLAEYFTFGNGEVHQVTFSGRAKVLQVQQGEPLPMMEIDGYHQLIDPPLATDTPWMRANKLAFRDWLKDVHTNNPEALAESTGLQTDQITQGYLARLGTQVSDVMPGFTIQDRIARDFKINNMAEFLTKRMRSEGYQVVEVYPGQRSSWHVILDPKLMLDKQLAYKVEGETVANNTAADLFNAYRDKGQNVPTAIDKAVSQPLDVASEIASKVNSGEISHDQGQQMLDLIRQNFPEPGAPAPLRNRFDVLVSRPKYVYPDFEAVSRQTKRATNLIRLMAKSTARDVLRTPTNELLILADGDVVRGGLNTDELVQKIRPQAPMVNGVARPDLGLNTVTQTVRMEVQADGQLRIELPGRLTQQQFDALGPAINSKTWDKVELHGPAGQFKVMDNPFGQQLQDAVSDFVAPAKIEKSLTPDLVSQYTRTGVFKGQAAVLADGTPVEVQAKAGVLYTVKDNFSGELIRVHPSKVTILPTSLEGEMAPSNLFTTYLSPEEQQGLAKLQRGLRLGLDQPIEKFKDLVTFANSRGYLATQVGKGAVELAGATDGESVQFENVKAAAEYVRKNTGPLPDLTPQEVKAALGGNINFGFIGGGGKPPEFGEMVPIPTDRMIASLENNLNGRGPGAFAKMMTPTRGLVLDMDKRFGTTFYPVFENIQSRYVGKQNFETLWFYGKGGGLPDGVTPLKDIMKLAGSDANAEHITALLEGADARPEFTKPEIRAASQLRDWYDGLFKEYGIEADYVQNYAPRVREFVKKYGALNQSLMQTVNDPILLSKGAGFWADNIRHGLLDVYDTDAWRVAARYLQQGANNRFMKEALDQGVEVVSRMGAQNQQLALPLAYFIQAVRGYEFWDQRIAISESAQRMLEGLGVVGSNGQLNNLAERMANYWMGAVYGSTMGARPGLALRNVATGLMMTWPLYGGRNSRFIEAMALAMTEAGRDAAVADRAIALKQGPVLAATMKEPVIGSTFDQISRTAFAMYDGSDQYTRAVSYWTARLKAEDALKDFFDQARTAGPEKLSMLKDQLIKDSGIFIQDKQIVDEFLRRAGTSPEGAARYAGKAASDVTNFLYGRGMQPRWMRGVGGRLFGQFATWPLWYIDYLRRSTMNMVANGYKVEAFKFLARHAAVNAAVLYAGRSVLNVDLGRWTTYPSVFYSGGPGFQVATALSDLSRGLGSVSSGSDDPLAQSRINGAVKAIQNTIPSMIPFYFAGKDAISFYNSTDATQRLANILSTRPTADYTFQRKLDMVLGKNVMDVFTGNPYVDQWAEAVQAGAPQVPIDQIPLVVQQLDSRMQQPGTAPPPAPAPVVPPAGTSPQGPTALKSSATLRVRTPAGIVYQNPTEVRGTTEPKPPQQY